MGQTNGRRRSWLVGSDHFHAVTANFYPRQSRRRRYVARFVCNDGALGRLRANRKSRIENRESENKVVVRFLFIARARFPRERTDRLDAALDACRDEVVCARCRFCEALQVRARYFAYARNRRSLGRAGIDPNTWRIS